MSQNSDEEQFRAFGIFVVTLLGLSVLMSTHGAWIIAQVWDAAAASHDVAVGLAGKWSAVFLSISLFLFVMLDRFVEAERLAGSLQFDTAYSALRVAVASSWVLHGALHSDVYVHHIPLGLVVLMIVFPRAKA